MTEIRKYDETCSEIDAINDPSLYRIRETYMENNLKKLSRADLIEIIYRYQQIEKELTDENALLKKQLEDRRTKIETAGSIAEASLAIHDVFAAAQKAADQYVDEVKDSVANVKQTTDKMILDAQHKADAIRSEAEEECSELRLRTKMDCDRMREQAESLCVEIKRRIREALKAQETLRMLLEDEE